VSDDTSRGQDPDDRAEATREQHRQAQEHNPDERPPEERQGGQDPTEEGLLSGVPGSAANRPTG
jgi:hypothetical protein